MTISLLNYRYLDNFPNLGIQIKNNINPKQI